MPSTEERIPAAVAPQTAAMSLAALAEGLAYYFLAGAASPAAAHVQILSAVARLYA